MDVISASKNKLEITVPLSPNSKTDTMCEQNVSENLLKQQKRASGARHQDSVSCWED